MLSRLQNSLSSIYHEFKVYNQIVPCRTIFDYLKHFFPQFSEDSWEERLHFGGCYVNGHEISGDMTPILPFWLEYMEPKFMIQDAQSYFPVFDSSWIAYEDDHLVAAWKPYGLSTLRTREQKHFNLKTYLTKHYRTKIHLPSRLDTSACGIVLISKEPSFDSKLQNLFAHRLIEKVYIAEGSGDTHFLEKDINLKILKDRAHPILRTVSTLNGKDSLTRFRKITSRTIKTQTDTPLTTTLFQVRPKTGRTHQIRVHSKAMGLPLVGDNFYGGYEEEQLHLMAYQMNFIHPVTQQKMALSAPSEKIPLWAKAAC